MKLCIDIGGTNTRFALVANDQLQDLKVFPTTDPHSTIETIFSNVCEGEYKQVNISTCGPVDCETGEYYDVPNLASWNGFNIRECIARYTNKEVFIENDANSATLYESQHFHCLNNFVYITLSTGIGAGAIVNGKLLLGKTGTAMSPHLYYVNPQYTLEDLCGGRAMIKHAQHINETIEETKDIFELSEDVQIKEFLDAWVDNIVLFLMNVKAFIDPEMIVLGGSVIGNNQLYFAKILEQLKKRNCNIKVELSKELNYNALLGAYYIDEY